MTRFISLKEDCEYVSGKRFIRLFRHVHDVIHQGRQILDVLKLLRLA